MIVKINGLKYSSQNSTLTTLLIKTPKAMVALIWIINFFIKLIGGMGFLFLMMLIFIGDPESLLIAILAGIVMGIIGLIWGAWSWSWDMAPQAFWKLSSSGLFETRVFASINSGILWFFVPSTIIGIIEFFA